jgi:hypothetical protein
MHCGGTEQEMREHFEISIRFQRMIERRIVRLESDAALDEAMAGLLENSDHITRQMRLVAAERQEANRMRRFLERSSTRGPSPTTPV